MLKKIDAIALLSCLQGFDEEDLRVTIQALGWRSGTLHDASFEEYRYLPLQDDIASTAFWYQADPHAPLPELPDRDYIG